MLDELIDALLYEGYALYPYTPGATKNATPTPFGILYPPAYAGCHPATFDHLRMEVGLVPAPDATVQAEVRFLQAGAPENDERGVERRVELPTTPLADLREEGVGAEFAFDGLTGRIRMRADLVDDQLARVRVCVHNTTTLASPDAAGRGRALESSLISTHPIARAPGSTFKAATEHPEWGSVNTFPVLATPEDDTVVGAAIVLPDHPQIAPESRGSLFDGTEIEEALLLHVHTLSDCEREAIAEGDPAVRAMVERAVATTPEDMLRLHGRLELRDPVEGN
jgi:hypothetical protein